MSDHSGISHPPESGTRTDSAGLDRLMPVVYNELCRIAHRQLGGERSDHTLDTTSLVHEAYLKLTQLDRIEWRGRSHFLAAAAGAMRRILVDYALARKARKRGGEKQQVPFDEVSILVDQRAEDLFELDEALQRLAEHSARAAQIVEWRYFGGMSIEETAEVLEISPATVKREWTLARAWLNRELVR